MPKGIPREWTLEELQTIWEFDGDNGEVTVTEAARGMGISHTHWYGMRSRLQTAGSPEALLSIMEDAKARRYNKASRGVLRAGGKKPDTLAGALARVYSIRVGAAGRGGAYNQFSVTIPPLLAVPFVQQNGLEVMWEPRDDGLLLKAVPVHELPDVPGWLKESLDTVADEELP